MQGPKSRARQAAQTPYFESGEPNGDRNSPEFLTGAWTSPFRTRHSNPKTLRSASRPIPARSAWTYFKRLWSFGLLERRSRGRGTQEYRISELGLSRLRWLRSQKPQ